MISVGTVAESRVAESQSCPNVIEKGPGCIGADSPQGGAAVGGSHCCSRRVFPLVVGEEEEDSDINNNIKQIACRLAYQTGMRFPKPSLENDGFGKRTPERMHAHAQANY